MISKDDEIKKLKFQLKLAQAIIEEKKVEMDSMTYLVLEHYLSEDEWDHIINTFNEYDDKIREGKDITWRKFEHELGLHYQSIKSYIIVFYDSEEFIDLCREYARKYDVMEFKRIIRSEKEASRW